jgi:phage gp46-like protein
MNAPVYELAVSQEDPLAEAVLFRLNTDEPVRSTVRKDTHRTAFFVAVPTAGNSSRLWLNFARPITDDTTTEIEERSKASLADLVPRFITEIDASASQVSHTSVKLSLVLTRVDGSTLEMDVMLDQGVPDA